MTSPITPAAPFPPGFGGGAKDDWFAHGSHQPAGPQHDQQPQPAGDLLGDWSTHFGAGGAQMKHAHSASNLDASQQSQIPRNPSQPQIAPNLQQFPSWQQQPPGMGPGPRLAGPMGGGWSSPQMGRPGGYPPGAGGVGNMGGNPGMGLPPRPYRPASTFNPAAFVMNQQKEVRIKVYFA